MVPQHLLPDVVTSLCPVVGLVVLSVLGRHHHLCGLYSTGHFMLTAKLLFSRNERKKYLFFCCFPFSSSYDCLSPPQTLLLSSRGYQHSLELGSVPCGSAGITLFLVVKGSSVTCFLQLIPSCIGDVGASWQVSSSPSIFSWQRLIGCFGSFFFLLLLLITWACIAELRMQTP